MSNKVLSQDEIDELLQAIESCEEDTKPEERTRKVKIFDFKRPDIIGKSTFRILSNILEEYCVSITKGECWCWNSSVAFQHQHSRFPLFGLMECFCSM